ncbi:MAG: acyl-ACP--UDP-N-acetylglucosamine O-acyltransferase [Acidobacteriota bacterium]
MSASPASTSIHPTAVVDPAAELGAGVEIGPHAVVGAGVSIGDRTVLGPGSVVHGTTSLGAENRLFTGACLGFDPQDLKFGGEKTRLEVGDGNQFREHTTVHRGTGKGGGLTRIGDRNLFMVGSHVAHDCMVGSDTIFANNGTLAGHVEVGDFATVGAFSSVHQFCRVGAYAYIGGYSVITRDALPFIKTVGAKPVCYGINRIGLERRGFGEEELAGLEKAYRVLVRSRQALAAALEQLASDFKGQARVEQLRSFVVSSERGVIRDVPGSKKGRRGG